MHCMVMVTWPTRIFSSPKLYLEFLKLETTSVLHWFAVSRISIEMTNCPSSGHGHGHVIFKIWEISDNVSEMVQDRDMITMKD